MAGIVLFPYPNDFCFLFLSLLMFSFIQCLVFLSIPRQKKEDEKIAVFECLTLIETLFQT